MPATLDQNSEVADLPSLALERVGDWLVRRSVPVFDEHVGKDGTHYNRSLLERIADNCNRRARATGDFCPLTVGHTSGQPGHEPPIVGFAKNFRVESHGRDSARPAIFADFYYMAGNEQVASQYLRRSVEIWNRKPEERFFDPIALLGGSTPKRDLGLYQRAGHDGAELLERYEMADGPADRYMGGVGGYSTNVPQFGGQAPHQYGPPPVHPSGNAPQRSPSGPLSPEAVQQIVAAMQQAIEAEVTRQMRTVDDPEPTIQPTDVGDGLGPGPGLPGAGGDLPGAPFPGAPGGGGGLPGGGAMDAPPPLGPPPAEHPEKTPAPAGVAMQPGGAPPKPPGRPFPPKKFSRDREDNMSQPAATDRELYSRTEPYRQRAWEYHEAYSRERERAEGLQERCSRLEATAASLREENETLRAENQDLLGRERYSRRRSEVEQKVVTLNVVLPADGIDGEMRRWGDAPQDVWDRYMADMEHRQRVPVGRNVPTDTNDHSGSPAPVESEERQLSAKYAREAQNLALREGIDYSEALRRVKAPA